MFSLFVAPLAGWVSIQALRDHERSLALKSGLLCIIAAMLWLSAPKNETRYSDDCFIDWDARSNATVCD